MNKKTTFIIVTAILVFICSYPTWALNSQTNTDSKQTEIKFIDNTTVTSEIMDFSMKASLLAFRNNVTVTNSQYRS